MPRLRSMILKVAGRCNINCTYCYMYNLADQSWHNQPSVMSDHTILSAFRWLESYLREPDASAFHVSLHGGEPLLCGREYVHRIADIRDTVQDSTGKPITMSLVTNGLLLDSKWFDLFHSRDISFGISLDGPARWHDQHRLTYGGAGTHSVVEAKVREVLTSSKAAQMFSGILCVLHPDMDGAELVRYFYELGVPKVDLLLPDQNHIYGSESYPRPRDEATYGRTLAQAYLEWRRIDDPSFRVRKFIMILEALLGRTPSLDSLGTGPITVFSVETSGEVEPVDTMKACGEEFTKSGILIDNVVGKEIESVPLITLGLEKKSTLPIVCSTCRNQAMCGGGYLPHRFSSEGFARQTVYCADMMYVCDTIRNDLKAALESAYRATGVVYGNALQP